MSQTKLDINVICRACAGPFHSDQTNLLESPDILKMFLSFSATEIDPSDCLPKSICANCNGRLENCKKFQEMCIASYQFLVDCFPVKCTSDVKLEETCTDKIEVKNIETHNEDAKSEISLEDIYEDTPCSLLDDERAEDSDFKEKVIEYDPLNDIDLTDSKAAEKIKLEINLNQLEVKETIDSDDDEVLADLIRKSKQVGYVKRKRQSGSKRGRGRGRGKRLNGTNRNDNCKITESTVKKLKRKLDECIQGGVEIKTKVEKDSDEVESENFAENIEGPENDSTRNKKFRSYACMKCPKTFLKKEIYEGHMRQHEGLKPFECDKCHKKYSRLERLTNHKLNDHSEQPKRFCCDVQGCDRKYRNRETLSRHLKSHFTPPPPRLDKSQRQVFICELCGKQLSTKGTLKEHEMMHKGESPYACDLCPKRFRVQHKLYLHKLRHQGVKNFKCEICGLKKTTNKELKSHMNIHTREKQFPCRVCGAVFLANGNLVRHVQVVHDGIKLYACSYCDKAFGKAETLRNHTMKHTGERPLKCPLCERRFISRTSLQYHVRRHQQDAEAAKSKEANEIRENDTATGEIKENDIIVQNEIKENDANNDELQENDVKEQQQTLEEASS